MALGVSQRKTYTDERTVHHDVYTSRDIFSAEMEGIFSKTWVNVGLTAELPEINTFKSTYLGTIPIIVTRDHNNNINVLQNECSHKGALVTREYKGKCDLLTCLYHHWQFTMDGTLRAAPKYGTLPKDDFNRQEYGLAKIPRVQVYHGIIYASLNPDVQPFEDFLADARPEIDDIFSFGEYEIIGTQRLDLHANWKAYVENAKDGYHAGLLHRLLPALGYFTDTRAFSFANGHGMLRWPTSSDLKVATKIKGSGVVLNDYSILETDRDGWNRVCTIFPNTLVSHQADILLYRQIIPLNVDRTEIVQIGLVPKGSSETFKRRSALQVSNYQGPSGWVGYDDILAMNAVQKGLVAPGIKVNSLALGSNNEDKNAPGESETIIRGFFKYWSEVLSFRDHNEEGDV